MTAQEPAIDETKRALSGRQLKQFKRQLQQTSEGDFVGAMQRVRRFRRQEGVVKEYKDGYYVRFYKVDEMTGKRVRLAQRLCDLRADRMEVEYARRAFMKTVNVDCRRSVEVAQGELESGDITLGKFYEIEYSRYVMSVGSGLRWSTANKYKRCWQTYCKELADRSLRNFRAPDCSLFLKSLISRGYRRSLIADVRAVCSSLFNRAVECKRVDANPWLGMPSVKVQHGPRASREYSVKERDAILALKTLSKEAKALFSLCSVIGLRPSEAAAMKWERVDFATGVLHVSEAASYGHLDKLKTEQSKRTLPITEKLLPHLKAWHAESHKPTSGLLFKRRRGANMGAPIKTNDFERYRLKRPVEGAHLEWKGLYAGRHLVHKSVWDATHDVLKVTAVTGNSPLVAMKKYLHATTADGIAAMRAVEVAQNGKKSKRA
jgi:integrase